MSNQDQSKPPTFEQLTAVQEVGNTGANAPVAALQQMLSGYWLSQAVYVAAKLGIADLLEHGPQRSEDLARATGTNSSALYRLLRALASVGVFYQEGDSFGQSPMSAFLRSGVPGSLRAAALVAIDGEFYRAWGDLLHSVKTGQSAFEHVFGTGLFDYMDLHPAAATAFHDALGSNAAQMGESTAIAYDFSGVRKVVDVGGGHGALLIAVLKAQPEIKGVLFDRASTLASAREDIESSGVSPRCELAAGDFFKAVPAGADAYILSFILHDWDDDRALAILQNCRRAMAKQGNLLVVEMVVPPGGEPSFGKLLDLHMLAVTSGGRERTEAEFRNLLARAGFRLTRVIPTASLQSVMEAMPV
jgi:ubiquinone/menaquinone biosynthesis C-methylase UbiE